jgi:hypothetical protein
MIFHLAGTNDKMRFVAWLLIILPVNGVVEPTMNMSKGGK